MRKNLRPEDMGDLLSLPKVAILATRAADGSTLLAPVWHEWRDRGFTIVIDGGDAKIRNLRRDPHISVVVAEDDPPYRGIEVRGVARVLDGVHAGETLSRLAERYLHGRDYGAYLDRMQAWTDKAVILRLEPVCCGPGTSRTRTGDSIDLGAVGLINRTAGHLSYPPQPRPSALRRNVR